MITSGNSVKTVKYAGPLYELHLRPHGNTADDQVHYIRAGATVAIYTRIVKKKSVTEKTRYLHKDHLGSIVALSDEVGAIAERLSFDPHGQRRETTWEAAILPIVPLETPRGFTGHEHLDDEQSCSCLVSTTRRLRRTNRRRRNCSCGAREAPAPGDGLERLQTYEGG